MRRKYSWALPAVALLAVGCFCLQSRADAPSAIILDEFAAKNFNASLWRVAPENPSCLQSDGAARLTYQSGATYSHRENITTLVSLPQQYVVQVNMIGGVQVVEMTPPPPVAGYGPTYTNPALPTGPYSPYQAWPGAAAPSAGAAAGPMPGMPAGAMGEENFQSPQTSPWQTTAGAGAPYAGGAYQTTASSLQQIGRLAQDAVDREARGKMTVTGHYIKATSYTSGPRVGISLLGPNFSVSVTFRGVGDPNPADTPGLCISSTFGAGERQVARIDAPAGEWVSLRLDVDGAKITVKANDKSPVVVTLPEPPMKIQLGDAGPEGKSFSVSDTVEYLFDDIRVFAGLGADLPDADYLSAGAWFLRHQYYDNAAVEFQRAGVASPHDAGATVAFGYARAFSQGNRLRLTESEQAVAGSPDLFSGHYYLGRYYLDMMRYDDAVRELRRALALAPDSPDVHTWLGLALFRREARLPDEELPTDGEALRHLEAATNLLPTSAEAHEALGLCLLTAKQGLRAQQELTEALELDAALFDPRLILTSLMSPADFNGDEAVANSRLLMDASDSYPYLVQALTSLAPSAASPGTRPAYSATPTATMTGGTLPTVRPPAAAVPGAGVLSETTPQYLSRANRWRDNGMLRPAVEEYRRWLGVLISQGNFGELVGDTLEMAEAYRMAGLDTMQAYALYLPTEPRNTEEREETGAYVEEHGGEFEAAYAKATSYPLSPDRGAWLTYMKGVVEMTTTSPTPRWRAAIGEFKKVEDMVSWPRRGDALIHTGSCYLALSRPYLAEDMFEMALKVYQREARRLAGLGESVASWEMGGLRAHLLNCAQYVNLARQLGGKEPKYDTSQIVLRGALPGGSAVVGGTTAALSQLLRTAALPGGASATTPASSATIRAFSNALVDFLASVYQTQVGEEDRRLIAAESGRNTPSDAVVRQVTSMVRQALNSLIGMSPSQQDAQRRTLRTAMSRGLASAPAGIPSAMLTLVRRLEASAPPLR